MDKIEWFTTDDNQYAKKISENIFEFVEFRSFFDELFGIDAGTIDYTLYSEEEILSVIEMFGYESIESLIEQYGTSYKLIICECIFETADDTSYLRTRSLKVCLEKMLTRFGIEHQYDHYGPDIINVLEPVK